MIRPDFQALLDLLGQWWIDQQGHEPNLGDLAERIAAATEDYGTVREQGRQDGIIDGRRGYVEVTGDQSRPVPRASAVGSIDRDALLREIDHAWSHAQRNYVLADRILALLRPVSIDRDALYALAVEHHEGLLDSGQLTDRILALVRPVEGDVTWREAEAVLDAIRACAPLNMELRTDPGRLGTEDPQAAAYVEGVHAAYYAAKQVLASRLEARS